MEESREKNAQSAQRASRIGFMQSLLGLSTPGSRTHAREQVDQKLEASGRKSEDVQRVKDFFDHLNEIAKEGSLPFPAHRFLMSGLIVMDLIVLQAFVSLGRLDLPATLALIALSIAIPTAAGSLFLGFVQQRDKVEIPIEKGKVKRRSKLMISALVGKTLLTGATRSCL